MTRTGAHRWLPHLCTPWCPTCAHTVVPLEERIQARDPNRCTPLVAPPATDPTPPTLGVRHAFPGFPPPSPALMTASTPTQCPQAWPLTRRSLLARGLSTPLVCCAVAGGGKGGGWAGGHNLARWPRSRLCVFALVPPVARFSPHSPCSLLPLWFGSLPTSFLLPAGSSSGLSSQLVPPPPAPPPCSIRSLARVSLIC